MQFRAFKYLAPLVIYIGAYRSFQVTGWQVWLPLIYAWIAIPVLELLIKPDPKNMNETEEELARSDKTYDVFLYAMVVLQYFALYQFLDGMRRDNLHWIDIAGRIWVMGLLCGTFGINVGHELGHRISKAEQFLAKALWLTSLYMHFFTEHNKGHHKRVATPEDPSSARYGEWIYIFYFRTIIFSYLSAWNIAGTETKKKGKPVLSLYNEMIRFTLIQVAFTALIFFVFGWFAGICFLAAAGIGILLLETVNYIEH